MRKGMFFFLLGAVPLLFVFNGCETSGNVDPEFKDYFVRYYGHDGAQRGVDIFVNEEDRSLMLLGSTSFQGVIKVYIVKTDWDGEVLWERHYGGPADYPKDLERASNGNFVVLSETVSDGGSRDVKLLIVSKDGEPIDSVTYGSPPVNGMYANEYPVSVTPLLDGGFIVTGSTEYNANWGSPSNTDLRDIFHYRFNADLTPYGALWGDEYGNASDFDAGVKTVQLRDERFYVMGHTLFSLDGILQDDYNIWFYPKGNDNSSGTIGYIGNDDGGNNEQLRAVCPSFNGGYFLVAEFSNRSDVNDVFVSTLSLSNGELIKSASSKVLSLGSRRISPVAVCQSFSNTQGYLILGNEISETGTKNLSLTKITNSPTFTPLWSSSFGALGRNDDEAGAIAELPDGRILIVGTVNLDVQNFKMVLIKLNGTGQLSN